jgi:predicted GIY-YIG superfamily endonuclease
MPERRYYCVYIMASLTGTLYIGVSGNLHQRIFQHNSIITKDSPPVTT